MPFTFQALIRILSLDHIPSPRSAFTLGTLGVELIKNEEILVYFNFLVGSSLYLPNNSPGGISLMTALQK